MIARGIVGRSKEELALPDLERSIAAFWARPENLKHGTLDASEVEAVSRMLHDRDKEVKAASFVLRRRVLTCALGTPHYLRFARFCANCGSHDHGAPKLVIDPSERLSFSITHSKSLAAIAVSRRCAIGVDIEDTIPECVWSELEQSVVNAGDDGSLDRTRLWTAKEAALKQTRLGLAIPMQMVTINCIGAEAAFARVQHLGKIRVLQLRWFTVGTSTMAIAYDNPVDAVMVTELRDY